MKGLIRKDWFAGARFAWPWMMRCLLTAGAFWVFGGAVAHAQGTVANTSYGYDEAGNKTSQVDALGRKTAWTFDAKNRVTGRSLPDGARETNSYDAADNLLAKTTFAGETLSFQYDTNNRVTGEVIPAGAGTNSAIAGGSVVSRYTPTGQLMSRQEQGPTTLGGLQSFKYNASDQLIEAKNPIGQISYSLDPMGNVLEQSIPGAGTVRYEHDDAGRLLKAIAADGKQARYTYDEAGRLVTIERTLNARGGQPQFLRTSFGYDRADRVILIAEVKFIGSAMEFVAGQTLTRGPGGVVSRIETARGDGTISTGGPMTATVHVVQSFEYDALGRLTRELRSLIGGLTDTRFEYDLVGNRTRKTVTAATGTEITTYSFDVADRLTQESVSLPTGGSRVISYTHDGNGNLASKTEPGKVTLYRFDPRNRLIDIRAGGTLAEAQAAMPAVKYAYDADGNRVRKSGVEDRGYLVDVNPLLPQVALETGSSGSIQYVRGTGLIRQIRTTSTGTEDLFPLHGHLGTSLGAVNADGDLVEQIDSDAFGNLDQPSGLKLTHIYGGEYWDQDAQLLYLRARWYDPKIGRFISGDPFEGRQEDPRSLNRYAYAHSNPIGNTDRTGLLTMGEVTTGLALVGTFSTTFNATTNVLEGNYRQAAYEVLRDAVFWGMGIGVGKYIAPMSKSAMGFFGRTFFVPLDYGMARSGLVLTKNMEAVMAKSGMVKPAGWQAHHIVGEAYAEGRAAMRILNKHKIDVNSPVNGVFLPGCGHKGIVGKAGLSVHCGKHAQEYERYILERLNSVGGMAASEHAVVNVLASIRRELMHGELILNTRGVL